MSNTEYSNVLGIIQSLTTAVDSLKNTVDKMVGAQQTSINAATNISVDTHVLEKPSKFKGDGNTLQNAAAARAFLVSFTAWATHHTKLSPGGTPAVNQWIVSFLSFMDGPAREWAVPYLEKIYQGNQVPWATWAECQEAFKTRFSVISSEETARDTIDKLKQGTRTLPDFAAEFEAVGTLTGYNDADLIR